MAITITQGITGIYPAYNDSYIKFTTGLVSPTYANIAITILGTDYTFKIYPDLTGEFLFNFKDAIKAEFNTNGFKDANADDGGTQGKSIAGAYDTLAFRITAYDTPNVASEELNGLTAALTINANAAGTFIRTTGSFVTDGFEVGEKFTASGFSNAGNNSTFVIDTITTTTNTNDTITVVDSTGMVTEGGSGDEVLTGYTEYEFFKAVKQVGETVFSNEAEVLAYSTDGENFYMTYFEGYPFTIDLKRITAGDTIDVKNLNSGANATQLVAASTNSYRLYIDDGLGGVWNALPAFDILNRLEIKINSVFKTNIFLKKVVGNEDCGTGIYVKWFNNQGGYSYWLFDRFYKTNIKAREKFSIAANDFSNVGSLVNQTVSGGYSAEEIIVAKAKMDDNEAMVLKDLLSSPSVQVWSAREPWQVGEWIDVSVSGDYSVSTKKKLNDITVNITLPELVIPSL